MGEISGAIQQEVKKIYGQFPIEKEPPIPTLDKPLIIESACPGWQEGGARYPAVPCTIEAQVKELTESFRAGAVVLHVHPRNPEDCRAEISAKLLHEVYGPVFADIGDGVTLQHTWTFDNKTRLVTYIEETEELLELGRGNLYCQGSVVLPANRIGMSDQLFTHDVTNEGIKWLEAHKVKPVYQLYDTYAHFDLKQYAIDTGLSTWKPYIFNLHLGKHHSHTIHKDPWSYLQLIANYNMVRETIADAVVGVYPGGRNWLPILIIGMLMGAPLVRVGIEDCYWIWPHKNDIIRKNSDMVELCVEIANILGRRVITDPKEAREYLGLTLTSRT